ncbi:MAG: type II toxin-antitoxin system VapB family antitoxin [Clostridiales bacterium]|nr:type II toxin-antitoxin system VapB family antitoxin [Clostridiales bacterium]
MYKLRTNILIDDEMMEQAMKLSGLTTKKDVVNKALYEFIQRAKRKNLAELQGEIQFTDDYNYKDMRRGR